jgi:hypothetical protein
MKYSADLAKKIIEGLEEVPNVRHIFKKLGIHRSTYYRWVSSHPEFREKVTIALHMGNDNINDLAKGNVIREIKEGDMGASKYWLSNRDPQFMNHHRHLHLAQMLEKEFVDAETGIHKGKKEPFDTMFEFYAVLEDLSDKEQAKEQIHLALVHLFEDEELIEIFYACYEAWKSDKKSNDDRIALMGQRMEEVKALSKLPNPLIERLKKFRKDESSEPVPKVDGLALLDATQEKNDPFVPPDKFIT